MGPNLLFALLLPSPFANMLFCSVSAKYTFLSSGQIDQYNSIELREIWPEFSLDFAVYCQIEEETCLFYYYYLLISIGRIQAIFSIQRLHILFYLR